MKKTRYIAISLGLCLLLGLLSVYPAIVTTRVAAKNCINHALGRSYTASSDCADNGDGVWGEADWNSWHKGRLTDGKLTQSPVPDSGAKSGKDRLNVEFWAVKNGAPAAGETYITFDLGKRYPISCVEVFFNKRQNAANSGWPKSVEMYMGDTAGEMSVHKTLGKTYMLERSSSRIYSAADNCLTGRYVTVRVTTAEPRTAVAVFEVCIWEMTETLSFVGENGRQISSRQVHCNEYVMMPEAPEREGLRFVGWRLPGTDEIYAKGENYKMPEAGDTVVLQAEYTKVRDVTFKDSDGTVLKVETVDDGADAHPPANPSMKGRSFDCWQGVYKNVRQDETVVAKYSLDKYQVTFEDVDGRPPFKCQSVAYGFGAVPPSDPSGSSGYDFVGWDKPFNRIEGQLEVKARYGIRVCEVIFKDYDGNVLKFARTEYGHAAEAPNAPDNKEGCVFVGWDKAFDNVTEDIEVVAEYKKAAKGAAKADTAEKCTVKFADWDGKLLKEETVDYGGAASAPEVPDSRPGWHFGKWDTPFGCVKADMTVRALYDINVYTVRFMCGGSVLNTFEVKHGHTAPTPEAPAAEGQHFVCWQQPYNCVEGSLDVEALYEEDRYIVRFSDYDGALIKEETVAYGGAADAPFKPEREGYSFAGWSLPFDNIVEDTAVMAMYNHNSYNVTYVGIDGEPIIDPAQHKMPITIGYGFPLALPFAPEIQGYVFEGWSDGTGIYKNIAEPYLMPAHDVKFSAVYKLNDSYTVKIGGRSLKPKYGSLVTLPDAIPKAPKGKAFLGWKVSCDAAALYQPGSAFVMPAKDVTVVPEWTKEDKITVTFKVEHGSFPGGVRERGTDTMVKKIDVAEGTLHVWEIPTGIKPDDGYMIGSYGWQKVQKDGSLKPSDINTSAGATTESAVYVYSFVPAN